MSIENLFENLKPEQAKILREQIERFNMYKNRDRRTVDIDKEIVLPLGTLIHGTGCVAETLKNISETGIITGQAFGIPEDGETFYCADFHRVSETQSLEDYNNSFSYSDGRCPFGTKGKKQVAFVIYPNQELKEIIDFDCYRNETQASVATKSFVNMEGLPIDDREKASSVLFGVPSCFISGVVLGDDCITEEVVTFISEKFPGAFITRNNGEVIYKKGDTKEILDLRLAKVMASVREDTHLKRINMLLSSLERESREKEEMWKAISNLPVETIAEIYDSLGYQGDTLSQAENFKNRSQR